MAISKELGPLEALVGVWEGDAGVDVAFSHSRDMVWETAFRERVTFSSFGPVDNGKQVLYGLDYRMSSWRAGEADPFHTEVGYWLWDAGAGAVVRAFMVPRGVVVLAGGPASADARSFTLTAAPGAETFGIAQNPYLLDAAKTLSYSVTVTIGQNERSYDESTMLQMKELPDPLDHRDRNTLRRVG